MAGDGGRVPDVSEQRCGTCGGKRDEPAMMSDDSYSRFSCPSPFHRQAPERSHPASVLAALLAESPEATVAAIEALLTSDEAADAAEEWLVHASGCANLTDAQVESATRRTILAACRSLRPKAPKEDRDA